MITNLEAAVINNNVRQLQPFASELHNHPNAYDLLQLAARFSNLNSLQILMTHHRYSPSELSDALTQPRATCTARQFLLACNIGFIDHLSIAEQRRLISYSIQNNEYDLLNLLIASGINVEITLNYEGFTPLLLALNFNNELAAISLLAAGAKYDTFSLHDPDMINLIHAVRTSSQYQNVPIDRLLSIARSTSDEIRLALSKITIAAYGFDPPPTSSYLSLLPHDIWEYYICPYLNLSRPTFNPSLS